MKTLLRQNARILIVDDEPANLKLLDRMLASESYAQRVLIGEPLLEVLGQRLGSMKAHYS